MTNRDEKGRLLPGHSVKGGRKPRAKELAILDAVQNAFTPEEIGKGLRAVYDKAEAVGSPKIMLAALVVAIEYGAGKPVQRVETVGDNPMAAMLEEWKQAKLEAFRDALKERMVTPSFQVIDGEVS